jgi:hypothetical protein
MAFVEVPNGTQAIIEYGDASGTVTWTNSLWFYRINATEAQMLILANALVVWANTYICPVMSEYWYVKGVTCYDMETEDGRIVYSTTAGEAGDLVGSTSPVTVAAVVTFRTASRGRSSRGRNYVAGFREDDTSATTFDGDIGDTLETAYEELMEDDFEGFDWSVCTRYTEGSPRENGLLLQITSVEVRNTFFGSQRRRVDRP